MFYKITLLYVVLAVCSFGVWASAVLPLLPETSAKNTVPKRTQEIQKQCLDAISADQKQPTWQDTERVDKKLLLPQQKGSTWLWNVKVKNSIGTFQYVCSIKNNRITLQVPFAP